MVKIDFDRPGLDSAWGATHKCWDGFPTDSLTMEPRGSPAEREVQNPEEDFEQMTILVFCILASEQIEKGNLERTPLEGFEPKMVPSEKGADEINPKVEPNPEKDLPLMTPVVPPYHEHVEDIVIAFGPEAENNPVDEWQQQSQDSTKPNMVAMKALSAEPNSFRQSQLTDEEYKAMMEKQLTSTPHESEASHCWSFFANLFKPQPSAAQAALGRAPLPTSALDDSDLERALLESASLTEAEELSASLARVRLQSVMEQHQAKLRPVAADGNCQFRALAHQLHGDENEHRQVRASMVQWLKDMKTRYSDFVHEPFDDYIARMARDGEWGDNVTLQAASDMLCRDIHILNDQPGAEHVSLHPTHKADGVTEKPLWLAFLAEMHYDAVEFL